MRSLVPVVLPSRAMPPTAPSWRDLLAFAEECLARREQRLRLGELPDCQIKDLGLSRADVERERRRWPWDGPQQSGCPGQATVRSTA
jgi:uncharacterized protein YjiS (DUF1127 family)